MMKKASKKAWFCKICGRFRANEKFSGKGHSLHVCKDCQRKIQEEKLTKKQVLKKEKANYCIQEARPSYKNATKISKIKQ